LRDIKRVPTGTELSLIVYTDAACTESYVSETVAIEDVDVELVKPIAPKGAPRGVNYARLSWEFGVSFGMVPVYLKLTAPGVVPLGTDCQVQYFGPAIAADSWRLNGLGAGEWVQRCGLGTVYGRAEIDGATATSTLSTTGVVTPFQCTEEEVLVQRLNPGYYYVVFDDGGSDLDNIGIRFDLLGRIPMVSSQVAGVVSSVTGPFQCASSPPPYFTCYIVETRDGTGTNVDARFSIAFL
jgi:hypothetical protein